MKKGYYVSMQTQSNGDHEVHVATCAWLPLSENRIYLGEYEFCQTAVREAQKHYPQVNGCKHCCELCHTK